MITNNETGNKVYIDIDIVFEDFKRSLVWESIKKRLPGVEEFTGYDVTSLRIRASSSGNAHIEISFNTVITVLENLCVRAWLNDDIYRLRVDMVRYLKTNNAAKINRLWSGKYKIVDFKGEMCLCQNWQTIPLDFMPAAREQWFKDQALKAQKDLDNEVRKEEINRASEGMRDAIIPSVPADDKNYDWPEMREELTPLTVETWKPAQQQQTSPNPPQNNSAAGAAQRRFPW
jgi:hypothetical protein